LQAETRTASALPDQFLAMHRNAKDGSAPGMGYLRRVTSCQHV
jgi:hypothetical protein